MSDTRVGQPGVTRIMHIDLSARRSKLIERDDLVDDWLGGSGLATALYAQYGDVGADPLGPDNPIVFAIGPLNVWYPVMTKVVSVFRSPLTGHWGESHAGGRFGAALRFAGFDAVVITGAATQPVTIVIHNDTVRIKSAELLWGMRSIDTPGRVLRERELGAGRRSILRIGRAGENLVKYACVNVDTYRHFGRLGLGAVFGSKQLKALLIEGTREYPIADRRAYRTLYSELYNAVVETDAMAKYHDLGTPANIASLNELGALPTRNFSSGRFEAADAISGERFAENVLVRKVACNACPIGCIHIGAHRDLFGPGYDYFTVHSTYDYELIYALGSNLGLSSAEKVLKLIERAERFGLDALSTGVVLAWATDAWAEGIVGEAETEGLEPAWDDEETYGAMIEKIANRANAFYRTLGDGVEAAADAYGGAEYAVALGGHENAGYHTGLANIVGMSVGLRHSHLSNAGYSIDQKMLGRSEAPDHESVVDRLIDEECDREVFTSLVGCFFARSVYSDERIVQCLNTLGYRFDAAKLHAIAKRIWREKYRLRKAMGFEPTKVRIPERLLTTPTPYGRISRATVECALAYYRSRAEPGWEGPGREGPGREGNGEQKENENEKEAAGREDDAENAAG